MICEKCHHEPATVYLTKIINGEKNELHLCENCAKDVKGIYINSDMSFQNLLSGFLKLSESNKGVEYKLNQSEKLKCMQCGMTYGEFKKKGKFGCSECYNTFINYLPPVLKRIHGNNIHTGKIPNRTGEELLIKKKTNELQQKLKSAIEKEEFEDAAMLRDKIRALKKEGGLC